MGDQDILATARINRIGVGRVFGRENGHIGHHHTFTFRRHKMEFGRVLQRKVFQPDVFAAGQHNQIRPRQRVTGNFLAGFLGFLPPDRAVAVNRALARECHVRQILAGDERDEITAAFRLEPVARRLS